jgi:predicted esterase
MVAPLLSARGEVLEHGMPRFFRRLAEGVFDEVDVRARAHELADFIAAARKNYGIAAPVALAYSNGANIAAAVMLLRPAALAGGILLRAMVPLASPDVSGGLAAKRHSSVQTRATRSRRLQMRQGSRQCLKRPEPKSRIARCRVGMNCCKMT